MGLVLGKALKFLISLANRLKIKVTRILQPIPTLREVTTEKYCIFFLYFPTEVALKYSFDIRSVEIKVLEICMVFQPIAIQIFFTEYYKCYNQCVCTHEERRLTYLDWVNMYMLIQKKANIILNRFWNVLENLQKN